MDRISALMDGEVRQTETRHAILHLKQSEECCDTWNTFHLIGDIMRGDPLLVAAALDISDRTVAKIRQNLFWAFAYNVAGIPLAALGFLNPVVAGAAMAMSSVSVTGNALLLKRWKLKK